jgi:hypothetical protein
MAEGGFHRIHHSREKEQLFSNTSWLATGGSMRGSTWATWRALLHWAWQIVEQMMGRKNCLATVRQHRPGGRRWQPAGKPPATQRAPSHWVCRSGRTLNKRWRGGSGWHRGRGNSTIGAGWITGGAGGGASARRWDGDELLHGACRYTPGSWWPDRLAICRASENIKLDDDQGHQEQWFWGGPGHSEPPCMYTEWGMRYTSTALYFYGESKKSLHKPRVTSGNMFLKISYSPKYYLQLLC